MDQTSKAVADLTDLTRHAASEATLRTGVAAILKMLVANETVGLLTATVGHPFQATVLGGEAEPLASNGWRYALEMPRQVIEQFSVSFTRAHDLFDSRARSQLACEREYFTPKGLGVVVARIWSVDSQCFTAGLCRQGVDFSDDEVRLLESIFPHLAVAMRMSQQLASDVESNFTAFCENYDLSHRQREIAQLIARGLRNSEIATLLQLTPNTVRNYIAEVFRRTKVSNRAEMTFLMSSRSWREDRSARHARELLRWVKEASTTPRASDG